MDIKKIISQMTLEEKISFCTGADMWHTKKIERLGIEPIMVSDGPHGLRCQKDVGDNLGINESLPATCFPTAVTAAATWNEKLIEKEGKALAEEALEYGVSVVLGPGTNIKRNPLGGRSFEYYSEDPVEAGRMSAAFIKGVQNQGIGVSLKHFACNNQEYKRQNGNSIVDERAMREIYLKPFEIAVRNSHPATVMCSYNQINDVYSSDNKVLLTDILRNEWGFDGLVMTDWGAMADRIKGFKAGCDLSMPGGAEYMEKAVRKAVENGELSEEDINRSAERILKLVDRSLQNSREYKFDRSRHHELARKIAEEGAVLLKNEGMLPLKREEMGVFGYFAENMRYQGAGSSHINPTELKQFTELFPEVPYAAGVDSNGTVTDLESVRNLASRVRKAVVFAGLPDSYESEGYDRDNMKMPEGYNRLIEEVAAVNDNVTVVLFGGSVMEIPWADKVQAILYMGLPGQAGMEAMMNILEGKVSPSGKLTETWPLSYDEVISAETFGKRNTEYRESIYVGYRYYDKADMNVRYPFGHGLSYSEFEYSDPAVDGTEVSVCVTNKGKVKAAETVQLYVVPKDSSYRAVRELKDFRKITLDPGETEKISFEISVDWFMVYDQGFKVCGGDYSVEFAASSRDVRCNIDYHTEGEKISFDNLKGTWYETVTGKPSREDFESLLGRKLPKFREARKGEFTMDNSCFEMKDQSLIMKIQYLITKSIISKPFPKEERTMDNSAYKMMLTVATDCPMRAVVINSNGAMNENVAKGMVEMANGNFIKGIKRMMSKD